jgi:hypothetical protein
VLRSKSVHEDDGNEEWFVKFSKKLDAQVEKEFALEQLAKKTSIKVKGFLCAQVCLHATTLLTA